MTTVIKREFVESPWKQGEDEQIVHSTDTTPWGGSPSAVAVVLKDASAAYASVTATCLSGGAVVVGSVITLPTIKSLTAGHTYRLEVKFTTATHIVEAYGIINAEM